MNINLSKYGIGNHTLFNYGKLLERHRDIMAYSPNYDSVAATELNSLNEYYGDNTPLTPI